MKRKLSSEESWNFAIGIVQTEGVMPSDYMLSLIEQEKNGEITQDDISNLLVKHYAA